jgi:hypothetical protein
MNIFVKLCKGYCGADVVTEFINAKRKKAWIETRQSDEVRLNWGLPTQTTFTIIKNC